MRQRWTEILPLLFVSSAVLAEAPVAVVRPSSVLLRTGEKVSISVGVGEPGRRLRAVANTGKLEGPDDPHASEQHFTYTPPPTRFPQTALLLFWVEEPRSAPEVAAVQIPLLGHTTLQINTEPDAQVRVQVADASFGPRRADKQGRVDIPIDVPPGALSAQVFAESRGTLTARSTPLDVPPVNPLAAALSPDPLPMGEDGWLIVAHTGSLDASQLWAEVAGGNAQRATSLPDRALFRITPGPTSERVSATVGLRNQPGARATAQASVAAAPLRTEIRTLAQRPPPPGRFSTAAAIGGFYAGGSSSGLALAIAGSYTLPWAGERFSLDAEVGFRSAQLSAAITGLGRVDSSLNGVPLELALRALIWRRGPWAISARLGGGALPFWTLTRSNFQPSFRQSKLGFEAFAAGQAGYRLGNFEVTGELRGAFAPASTPNLDARLGGAVLAFGARYDLR
jgi:hypothetical protein